MVPTKMGMLKSGIAEPLPPDPFAMPMSRYRETRMKSTKDLLHLHKSSQNRMPDYMQQRHNVAPAQETLYTNTTQAISP